MLFRSEIKLNCAAVFTIPIIRMVFRLLMMKVEKTMATETERLMNTQTSTEVSLVMSTIILHQRMVGITLLKAVWL